jgi:MFS family permease
VSADSAFALFSALGMLGAIPFSYLSDRIGSRKGILIVGQVVTLLGVGLLSFASYSRVWVIMIAVGLFREARPALGITLTMELDGVGSKYAGTALGLRGSVGRVGGIFGPPLGHSFAVFNAGFPFLFWAALGLISVVFLGMVKETKKKMTGQ